ncbi:hypothetical protein M7I_6355 [Glarea lozoyensis 74030]|uniref:Uncharacterized protein n=1 Tax=Glarea lozoyensis (strain ATCC 74030 / MF5533) TaxID=1104152 RepID=H0EUC2_GLAL7|nr:hypothetical protein M7I_6355 [Glarea lozoyensis 74030]
MNASTNGTQHVMQGWTSSPDQRGTIDILFSCCLTTLLCCWTSVCPNVPAKNDSKWMQLQDKMNLAFMGLLGPEFLLMLALGQWASARRSVKMFRAAGYEQWTMTHAFFADMGGIMLQTPGYPEFPVDAEQLYYLIDKRYIEYPDIHKADIDDKNKSDGLARLITVCQTLWFTISCVARPLQSLSLTTIELTTLSFILLYLFISFAWRHKPIDVSRPLTLHTTTPISRIHSEGPPSARAPTKAWGLDFISRREYFMSLFWSYFTNLAYTLHIPLIHLFTRRITSRPHDRIRTDHFAATDALSEVLSAPLIGAYAVIFALAWDFEFPSRVEQMLWRASSHDELWRFETFNVAEGKKSSHDDTGSRGVVDDAVRRGVEEYVARPRPASGDPAFGDCAYYDDLCGILLV